MVPLGSLLNLLLTGLAPMLLALYLVAAALSASIAVSAMISLCYLLVPLFISNNIESIGYSEQRQGSHIIRHWVLINLTTSSVITWCGENVDEKQPMPMWASYVSSRLKLFNSCLPSKLSTIRQTSLRQLKVVSVFVQLIAWESISCCKL